MNGLMLLFQVGSVIVSALVSRAIVTAIMSRLGRKPGSSFWTTPGGSALVFGFAFVIVWFVLSFAAVLAWLMLRGST